MTVSSHEVTTLPIFNIVAIAGFERNYTVNETDGLVEVCVLVTNPPPMEELVFPITLTKQTRDVTATGKLVFL